MSADSRFETMHTSYGRTVEVGRLCFVSSESDGERVILDVPRRNPEYDSLWLAMSPKEAHRLAALLDRCATAAEQAHHCAAGRREPTERLAA
jgi:hypothetical protein